MTIELGYNNDDFAMDRTTAKCKDGDKITYCSFPSSHPVINENLYLRVVVFKLRRVSARLFHMMGEVKERTAIKINFESIWPNYDGNRN